MGITKKLGIKRTSRFVATVTVHELLQVPFVEGKFRLKWKFAHPDSSIHLDDQGQIVSKGHVPGKRGAKTDTLARPHTQRENSGGGRPLHGDDYPTQEDLNALLSPQSDPHPAHSASHGHLYSLSHVMSKHNDTATGDGPPGASLTRSQSAKSNLSHLSHATRSLARSLSRTSASSAESANVLDDASLSQLKLNEFCETALPPAAISTAHKASTPYFPLRAHTVVFNQKLCCPVSMHLSSGEPRNALKPCPLKLQLFQRIARNGVVEEVPAGQVVIDLSHFVEEGARGTAALAATSLSAAALAVPSQVKTTHSKRFLLQKSSTNATLRVTIEMRFVGGEAAYRLPASKSAARRRVLPPTASTSSLSLVTSTTSTASFLPDHGSLASRSNSSGSLSKASYQSVAAINTNPSGMLTKPVAPSSSLGAFLGSHGKFGHRGTVDSLDHESVDIVDAIFENRPIPQHHHHHRSHSNASSGTSSIVIKPHSSTMYPASSATSPGHKGLLSKSTTPSMEFGGLAGGSHSGHSGHLHVPGHASSELSASVTSLRSLGHRSGLTYPSAARDISGGPRVPQKDTARDMSTSISPSIHRDDFLSSPLRRPSSGVLPTPQGGVQQWPHRNMPLGRAE